MMTAVIILLNTLTTRDILYVKPYDVKVKGAGDPLERSTRIL